MNRAGCLVGAGILLGGMAGPVEARVVRYEIDGKVYAYETTDRQQVERARQRIGVAYAAYAAKVRADAELVSNPLLKVLGSRAQWEAAAAQARLQQVMSQQEPPPPAASPVTTRPSAKPQPTPKVGRADNRRPLPELKTEPNRATAREGTRSIVSAGPYEPKAAGGQSIVAPLISDATLGSAPKSISLPGAHRPALKSVTLDLSSGIKTLQMTDGTIHEEPLESSTVSKLGSVEPAAESLTSFVEQVRSKRSDDAADPAKPLVKGSPRN